MLVALSNQVGIFYDLTKAYNAINPDIPLSKLREYGVRGTANIWFKSYLAHQKQVEVSCNGKKMYISTKRNLTLCATGFSPWIDIVFTVYKRSTLKY
jgi:hypothetical protein